MEDKTRVFLKDCMEARPGFTFKGRKHSEETKRKMRESMLNRTNPMQVPEIAEKRSNTLIANGTFAGPNSHRWRGGDRKYRGPGWQRARQERKKLDGFKCCDCGRPEAELGRSLDVHHIVDFKDGGTNAISNLVSLCRSCHNKRRAGHGR